MAILNSGLCTAVVLVILIAIPLIHTQNENTVTSAEQNSETTESSQSLETTTYAEVTSFEVKQIRKGKVKDGLDDIAMDEDEHLSNFEVNPKILSKTEPAHQFESASKVQESVVNQIPPKKLTEKTKQPVQVTGNDIQINSKYTDTEEKSDLRTNNVRYDEVTGELITSDHPCHRACREGEEPMICYYHFELEWYHTLSKACYNCPLEESDCFRPDCIPADGMRRSLNVINRQMPGPAIEVCLHDRVIVDVENGLMAEGTTVHWHGLHQKGTPFMDGTPLVTQCPILPESTFRYQFNASEAGTHWWHSHSGMQRADGAAGAFVIRKPMSQETHARLYDHDRSEHVMIVTDWIHELAVSMFTDHHHSKGDNKPPTLLINGLGRFQVFTNETTGKEKFMRAARFNVEQGFRYRFRVINAEFLNCPIEMSIDGHNITVINSDGHDLEPITATSLVTYAGERYDFILDADNEIDNYWIRFRGLMDCDERFTKAKQVAVLHYEGAMESEPPGHLTWEESYREGLQLNALNKGEEEEETISIAEMKSVEGYDDTLKEVADYQFYIAYDFYPKNNTHFNRSPHYGFFQVPDKNDRLYTPQLNHITLKMPHSPLLVDRPSSEGFCNSSSIDASCKKGFCQCPHVLSVKLNSIVELIIVDEGVTFDANHPFHLHGHSFRVLGLRRLSNVTTIDQVKAFDQAGLLKRNLKNPPIKDTVTVPDGGYTVVRFKANNPGYWFFHCHIEFHVEVGMGLIFKVGEHSEMEPIPPNFPRCGNYMPDNMLELATTTTQKPESNVISITHWWPLIVFNSNSTSSASCNIGFSVVLLLSLVNLLRFIF